MCVYINQTEGLGRFFQYLNSVLGDFSEKTRLMTGEWGHSFNLIIDFGGSCSN